MKRLKFVIAVLFITGCITACKKTTNNVNSKIVEPHYPTITLNGQQFVSIPISSTGSYTDVGAVGKDDITGQTTKLTPGSNDVNVTEPGFYTVKFSFRNDDGYGTTKTRFVLVTSVSSS